MRKCKKNIFLTKIWSSKVLSVIQSWCFQVKLRACNALHDQGLSRWYFITPNINIHTLILSLYWIHQGYSASMEQWKYMCGWRSVWAYVFMQVFVYVHVLLLFKILNLFWGLANWFGESEVIWKGLNRLFFGAYSLLNFRNFYFKKPLIQGRFWPLLHWNKSSRTDHQPKVNSLYIVPAVQSRIKTTLRGKVGIPSI